MPDTPLNPDALERFWSKVEKTSGCWNWIGSITPYGYGQFSAGRKNHRAHRISYFLLVGEIPEGLVLDHLCRNRSCVNPEHLEPVTSKENILRGFGPTAENARKEVCEKGHPLVLDYGQGRRCKPCSLNRSAEYNRVRRGANLCGVTNSKGKPCRKKFAKGKFCPYHSKLSPEVKP